MATNKKAFQWQDTPSGKDLRIGIAVAEWHSDITSKLLEGCRETLEKYNVEPDNIEVVHVPGSFELPMGARILLQKDKFDALICLGCIIKGETSHDQYISQAVASAIMQLGLMSNTPTIFGVLTPDTVEQAMARAGGDLGNKGIEAAVTALRMAALKKKTGEAKAPIGFSI